MKACPTVLLLFFLIIIPASAWSKGSGRFGMGYATENQSTDSTAAQAQSRESLRLACLNEAEVVNGRIYSFHAPSRGHSEPRIPNEIYQAKDLCHQMTNLQKLEENDDLREQKTSLARKCGEFLGKYALQYPSDKRHIRAMRDICQKMTSENVPEVRTKADSPKE
jgi:hypothetical protein